MKSRDSMFFKRLVFSHTSEQIFPFQIYFRIYFESIWTFFWSNVINLLELHTLPRNRLSWFNLKVWANWSALLWIELSRIWIELSRILTQFHGFKNSALSRILTQFHGLFRKFPKCDGRRMDGRMVVGRD